MCIYIYICIEFHTIHHYSISCAVFFVVVCNITPLLVSFGIINKLGSGKQPGKDPTASIMHHYLTFFLANTTSNNLLVNIRLMKKRT